MDRNGAGTLPEQGRTPAVARALNFPACRSSSC